MSLGIYLQGEDNRVCLWFSYSVWKRKINLDSTVCFLSSAVNSNAIYLEREELIRIENRVQCWHVKLEMFYIYSSIWIQSSEERWESAIKFKSHLHSDDDVKIHGLNKVMKGVSILGEKAIILI